MQEQHSEQPVEALSQPFQQLAARQGVTGIQARSYTLQFFDLATFVTVDAGTVVDACVVAPQQETCRCSATPERG